MNPVTTFYSNPIFTGCLWGKENFWLWTLGETEKRVSTGGGRHWRKPDYVLITWQIPCFSFIGHWIYSRNVILQKGVWSHGVPLVSRILLPSNRIWESSALGRFLCQNDGGKSEMVSAWPAAIFSKLKWLWGLASAPHNTGRLCLILGAWSSSVSLWFMWSVLTAPAKLELQTVIVLVIEMVHSLMCFQVLCPMNPVGKKTILHPST